MPFIWLTQPVAGTYMIIRRPFEANLLLPSIKNSLHVTLHVYAPRINLLFPCLQDLKVYTTPALPAYPGPCSTFLLSQ